jgi:hypothetical protein
MLAYHVEWNPRQRLAPMLDEDSDKQTAEALRSSVVAAAERSPCAVAKQADGTTPNGFRAQSSNALANLASLAPNVVTTAIDPNHEFVVHARRIPAESS